MIPEGDLPKGGTPELSVVLPCYNCASSVADSITTLRTYLDGLSVTWEIVPVDDGSSDRTRDVLRSLSDGRHVAAVHLAVNRGKGRAVSEGMARARGRYRIFTDADLPFRLDNIGRCLDLLREGRHAVFGNRRMAESVARHPTGPRRWAGGLVRLGVGWIVGRSDLDTQCGLKGFSGELADVVFPMLRLDRFLFDVELSLLLERNGIAIDFVPVVLVNQEMSTIRLFHTGIRTVGEAWQLWLGRRRSPAELQALTAFARRMRAAAPDYRRSNT